jgi:uncharacterized protein DUF6624
MTSGATGGPSTAGDPVLRDELLAMAAVDQEVRAQLAADGSLFEGYHPRMEAVHRRNAVRLEQIIAAHGWPGRTLVGADGADAAWMILHHAIGNPTLQRRGLALVREAEARSDADPQEVAMLEDRVRFFEGRPQLYGTQFDWDETGVLTTGPIEDPAGIDERRRAAGFLPLAEQTARMREQMAASTEAPPADPRGRRREMEAWARSVGWRD